MNKIGLSFYLAFIGVVTFSLIAVATLAEAPDAPAPLATSPTENAQKAPETLTQKGAGPPNAVATPTEEPKTLATDEPQDPEERYRARLTAALRPLIDLKLSDADKKSFAAARKALLKRQPDEVRRHKSTIKQQDARKLVDWLSLRAGFGGANDLRQFLDDNPKWPDQRALNRRMEQALFDDGHDANGAIALFEKNKPTSDVGLAAHASAYLALGRKSKAKQLAAQAWCGGGISGNREKPFLDRFGKILKHDDHRCRLNRLLVDNLRWTSARRRRATAVRRVIKLLPKAEQAKATARLAAFLRQRVAQKWLKRVPASQTKDDWGFAFQKVQHLRRLKRYTEAWALLKSVPTDPDRISQPDAWWEERHSNALAALRQKKSQLAYDFVADIRPSGVNAAKDQAFFAGWLALRMRGKPKLALAHFQRMRQLVDGPLSTSKAEFWLGRTQQALGQQDEAHRHYQAGARFVDTFHGLLSRQMIAPKDAAIDLPLPEDPQTEQIEAFLSNETVRAAVVAHRAGLPRGLILRFFRAIARNLETEAEMALFGQLAKLLGDGQLEVRIGKTGVARGFNLYIFSYPKDRLPDYKPLRKPPEQALVLAIARQESEFNTRIVSGAGARGLLQVMPITAKHVCQDYKIKCRIADLLKDPSYNTRIATAYIADRTDDFGGSYILTFTGYNAGPGRTRQWLRAIGDPRSPRVEPLDWIYRIPFEETRSYAQKVLSNLQVYRARLGEENPLRLRQDMNRARRRS
ncbi:MAG: transglycosylase SLT domain-containing protein [Hyphomicrobiaceae bacterium]